MAERTPGPFPTALRSELGAISLHDTTGRDLLRVEMQRLEEAGHRVEVKVDQENRRVSVEITLDPHCEATLTMAERTLPEVYRRLKLGRSFLW